MSEITPDLYKNKLDEIVEYVDIGSVLTPFIRFRKMDSTALAKIIINKTSKQEVFNKMGILLNSDDKNTMPKMHQLSNAIETQRAGGVDYKIVWMMNRLHSLFPRIPTEYKAYLEHGVIPPDKMEDYERFVRIVNTLREKRKNPDQPNPT